MTCAYIIGIIFIFLIESLDSRFARICVKIKSYMWFSTEKKEKFSFLKKVEDFTIRGLSSDEPNFLMLIFFWGKIFNVFFVFDRFLDTKMKQWELRYLVNHYQTNRNHTDLLQQIWLWYQVWKLAIWNLRMIYTISSEKNRVSFLILLSRLKLDGWETLELWSQDAVNWCKCYIWPEKSEMHCERTQ